MLNQQELQSHNADQLNDQASFGLDQLLASCLPRLKLLPRVTEKVRLVMEQYAIKAHIPPSVDQTNYLQSVAAIPLPLELCTLMIRVGFDEALFTYGRFDGRSVGYTEASWLLEFVGLANEKSR